MVRKVQSDLQVLENIREELKRNSKYEEFSEGLSRIENIIKSWSVLEDNLELAYGGADYSEEGVSNVWYYAKFTGAGYTPENMIVDPYCGTNDYYEALCSLLEIK